MKTTMIAGIILVVIGVISLGYQGISYTTRSKGVDVGPVHVDREEHKTIPLPPILGGFALAGGIVLILVGGKRGT
jgi:hypothetical protein